MCTIFHHISSYFIIFHHISSYFIIFHHISSYFIIFHHISSYFIIFHHISSYFIIFHHISSYFIILPKYEEVQFDPLGLGIRWMNSILQSIGPNSPFFWHGSSPSSLPSIKNSNVLIGFIVEVTGHISINSLTYILVVSSLLFLTLFLNEIHILKLIPTVRT